MYAEFGSSEHLSLKKKKKKLPFEKKDNITQTRLFKYIENFTTKTWKFSDKKSNIFFIFLLKT